MVTKKTSAGKSRFLHQELTTLLKEGIAKGLYKPGDRIPSERELIQRHGWSRTTVRRGLAQLVAEGYLHSIPGTATFVAETLPTRASGGWKTRTIACVLRLASSPFDSPYYACVFRGMQEEAARSGYHISFHSILEQPSFPLSRLAREGGVDGVILVGPLGDRLIADLCRTATPLVTIDHDVRKRAVTAILPDNRRGALEAVQHLIGLGHKRIAFLGARQDDDVSDERRAGYGEALARAGLRYSKVCLITDALSVQAGRAAMAQLLGPSGGPTAILAMNDEVAIGAIQAARDRKLRVPADISIVGFDDIAWAAHAEPPLTTVRIEKEETGALAVRMLAGDMDGQRSIHPRITTPVHLIVRGSTAAPRRARK